jgi:hypothetical protein
MSDEPKTGTSRPSEVTGSGSPLITHHSSLITHSIRLRGFWETSSDGVRTTHARQFGRPRTADPGERVWLVCGSVPGPAEVSVNGQLIGTLAAAGPFAADVTDLLLPRNAVRFAVESDQSLGEVAVEIRATAN